MIKGRITKNAEATKRYNEVAYPYIMKGYKVSLTKEELEKIKKFTDELSEAKSTERHHIIDNNDREGRFFRGFCGELALQKFLKRNFLDFTIGKSENYFVDDMKKLGIQCGVKTAMLGSFHKVLKKIHSPEVMVVIEDESNFLICGVAMPDILIDYQDDTLPMDAKLKARGTKSCFYGYEHLKRFKNFTQLNEILYEEGFSDTI